MSRDVKDTPPSVVKFNAMVRTDLQRRLKAKLALKGETITDWLITQIERTLNEAPDA